MELAGNGVPNQICLNGSACVPIEGRLSGAGCGSKSLRDGMPPVLLPRNQ